MAGLVSGVPHRRDAFVLAAATGLIGGSESDTESDSGSDSDD